MCTGVNVGIHVCVFNKIRKFRSLMNEEKKHINIVSCFKKRERESEIASSTRKSKCAHTVCYFIIVFMTIFIAFCELIKRKSVIEIMINNME